MAVRRHLASEPELLCTAEDDLAERIRFWVDTMGIDVGALRRVMVPQPAWPFDRELWR